MDWGTLSAFENWTLPISTEAVILNMIRSHPHPFHKFPFALRSAVPTNRFLRVVCVFANLIQRRVKRFAEAESA